MKQSDCADCLFSSYCRGNLVKAEWIPSEQIVELHTPAVSTRARSETTYQYPQPVINAVCLNLLCLCRESFGRRWVSPQTASSTFFLKKLCTWWSVWVSERTSSSSRTCHSSVLWHCQRPVVTHLTPVLCCVNRETCRCFTRTCRCPYRTAMRDSCPRAQWASSSIRYESEPSLVTARLK